MSSISNTSSTPSTSTTNTSDTSESTTTSSDSGQIDLLSSIHDRESTSEDGESTRINAAENFTGISTHDNRAQSRSTSFDDFGLPSLTDSSTETNTSTDSSTSSTAQATLAYANNDMPGYSVDKNKFTVKKSFSDA